MCWLNSSRKKLVIGIVDVMVLFGGIAKADFIFGELTNLGSPVNSSSSDVFGCLSADDLEIYIERADGSTDWRYYIWVAKRPTIDDEWGTPMRLGSNVNTSGLDNWEASISADGLELYFSRGSSDVDYDLYVATRETTDDEWLAAVSLGDTVNTSAREDGASISADGLSLYFISDRDGGEGSTDLYVTRRESTDHAWGMPVNLGPTINSPDKDLAPSISSDGLLLLFSSERQGGHSSPYDIWMAKRGTTSDPWEEPINLGPEINTDDVDLATISPDGQTLYLTCYVRSGGMGGYDIWKAPIIPIVDLNGDGVVDAADMCIMADHWGTDNSACDIGPMPWGDGVVDVEDLKVLAEHLFQEAYDPTLVVHWPLDEAEGMVVGDAVGENQAFAVGDPVWQPDGGQAGGALLFDGVDDFISAPAVLNPADGPFSVFAWIKDGAPGQVIIAQQTVSDWLSLDAEGKLMTDLKCVGRSAVPLVSEAVITDGQWHRVGLAWDGSNRTLIVDDVVVAEDVQALESSDRGLYISAGKDFSPDTFFSGLIDDIRIYNRAVSP